MFMISFTACIELEYIELLDVAPQLEITVLDISENIVEGATVKLYATEDHFLNDENAIQTTTTDGAGKALFQDLSESIYYFYAEKGDQNNFYDIASFDNPLNINEIRTLSCTIR